MDEELTGGNTEPESNEVKEEKVSKTTGLSLERLETEIKTGYRIFMYNNKEFHICFPSVKDDELLSRAKAKVTSDVLKDKDICLKEEISKMLTERGIWDETKERRERELRERYSKCLGDIYLERSKMEPNAERLTELHQEKMSLDIDIALLTETKSFFMSSTAESRVEELMLKHKLALCLKNADGTRIWNSIDEFEACTDKAFINTISTEAIYFWAGLDQSMFDLALGN